MIITNKYQLFPFYLVIITTLLFLNTLWGEFVYDDLSFAINNPEIKYWHFWDLWHFWSRSTRTLTLMIDYHLFGYSPFGYHLHNILWHLLSVLLLYYIFAKLSEDYFFSFLGALFFAVHPIHVEAIANITNRKETLCMAFSLSSFILYLRFTEYEGKRKWIWLLGSLFAWYLALNSKQVAIAFPFMLIVYEYLFLSCEKRFLTRKPFILSSLLISGSILLYWFVFKGVNITKSGLIGDSSLYSLLINSARAFWLNIQLLLFPINLAPDYAVKFYTSLFDPIIILSWVTIIAVIFLSFFLVRKDPLTSFSLSWILIHYLPVSNLVPSAFIVADRYMYIPSAGFCMLIVSSGKNIFRPLSSRYNNYTVKKVFATLVVAVLSLYSIRTFYYNKIWNDPIKLWSHQLKVFPKTDNAYFAFFSRAAAYKRLGKYKEALSDYSRAARINPNDSDLYINVGTIYGELGANQQAIDVLVKAIEIDPKREDAYFSLGLLYSGLGDREKARWYYEKAVFLGSTQAQLFLR